jgi:Domain of unknown function (DUF397)
LDNETWRKSSYSGGSGGNCVEVGQAARTVAVRDTKNRDGAVVSVSAEVWSVFMESLKH